jgi:hypothetical protein
VNAKAQRTPWSTDRWGRFLAGLSMLILLFLGTVHHVYWLYGAMACAGNLLMSSLTNWCVIHRLLIYLGVREREDIFLPGGRLRV